MTHSLTYPLTRGDDCLTLKVEYRISHPGYAQSRDDPGEPPEYEVESVFQHKTDFGPLLTPREWEDLYTYIAENHWGDEYE